VRIAHTIDVGFHEAAFHRLRITWELPRSPSIGGGGERGGSRRRWLQRGVLWLEHRRLSIHAVPAPLPPPPPSLLPQCHVLYPQQPLDRCLPGDEGDAMCGGKGRGGGGGAQALLHDALPAHVVCGDVRVERHELPAAHAQPPQHLILQHVIPRPAAHSTGFSTGRNARTHTSTGRNAHTHTHRV
jgi:hypothetical protein